MTFDGSGLSSGVYFCRLRVRSTVSAVGRTPSDTVGGVFLALRMLLVR